MKQIKLDKVREVRLGLYELEIFEEETGIPFSNIIMSELRISDMYKLLWAGMVTNDKELTIEKVKSLVQEHSNYVDMYTLINEAFGETMPQQDDVKPVKNAKRA